jgi:hypothetical protein
VDELVLDVAADSRWVPVLVGPDDDVDAWAVDIATEALRIRGFEPPSTHRLEQATAVLAGIAHSVRQSAEDAPLVGAWSLMPGPEVVPETLATLRPLFPEGVRSRGDMVDELVAAPGDRYGEPQIDELDTPSGVATRIVQRLLAPADALDASSQRRVEETVAYVWWFEAAGMALVLSTYFLDLVESGRWRPECDDLARLITATVE